jgi:hypothetical protein
MAFYYFGEGYRANYLGRMGRLKQSDDWSCKKASLIQLTRILGSALGSHIVVCKFSFNWREKNLRAVVDLELSIANVPNAAHMRSKRKHVEMP